MPVFLVKTSGKISLWCFKLASWRRKNFKLYWRDWDSFVATGGLLVA